MKRTRLEKMMKDRWHEQTELIATAGELFVRCIEWPEKQDESFVSVLDAMQKWLKKMKVHSDNLDVDLIFLRK